MSISATRSLPGGGGMSRVGVVMSGERGGYVQRMGGMWVCDLRGSEYPSIPQTWDTMEYGQEAGGTHPTGMLSYFILWLLFFLLPSE